MINIKSAALENNPQEIEITINERLPEVIMNPVIAKVTYQAKSYDNYYLLTIAIKAELKIACQRCLGMYATVLETENIIAVCPDEETAERVLTEYESITTKNDFIDLEAIITDELHLSCPLMHSNENDCDKEVIQYLD